MIESLPSFEHNVAVQSPARRGAGEGPSLFREHFVRALVKHAHDSPVRNRDYWRFPAGLPQRVRHWSRDALLSVARGLGFLRVGYTDGVADRLVAMMEDLPGLERTYDRLGDACSKNLLIELLCLRLLGPERVRLSVNNNGFREKRRQVDRLHLERRNTAAAAGWPLHQYGVAGIRMHCHPGNVLTTFLLEQYAYRKGSVPVAAGPDDVVVDGGACWGDTSLYFAEKAGRGGKVLAFEFAPENLPVLRRNLAENPRLAENVEIMPRALWDGSGETLLFESSGPATRLGAGGFPVESLALDDMAEERGSVDFIKLDIEGAELRALRGAEQTIRRFKPKLAVSVYHRPDDLVVIPDFLDRLEVGYRFFLDHFTIHQEETVLFATTDRTDQVAF